MNTTPTQVHIGDEEREILDAYKATVGLSMERGNSAAIRAIIRECSRLKAAEVAGQIRRSSKQAA